MSTIDDERDAFIRDLLRVLTSLYSWAGAVVHGQTEDGHDVIELCDGTRVWTEPVPTAEGYGLAIWANGIVSPHWPSGSPASICHVAAKVTYSIAETRIRDLLSGPPEDA